MAFEILSTQLVARASGYDPSINAPVNTSAATAVLVFVSSLSQPAGTPVVKVGGVTASYLGKINNGTNSSAWAFALLNPPKGATTQVNVSFPNTYLEGGVTGIVALDGALSFGFFDAKTGNPDIVLGGTTLKGGGKVISFAHGAYIADIELKGGTGGSKAPTMLLKSTANANSPSIIAEMEYSGVGVAVTTTIGKPASVNNNNPYGGVMVEVEGSAGPPKQSVSVTGIGSTAKLGAQTVARLGEKLVGPAGIQGTRGIGTPTISKQTLAIWDPSYSNADLTLSGSPALTVEKTAAANTHSLVLGSLPVAGNEKKYMEFTVNALGATTSAAIGFTASQTVARNVQLGAFGSSGLAWTADGQARHDNAGLSGRLAWAVGDVLMVAIDTVNGWVFFGKNGVWQNAGNASQPVSFANGDGKANNSAFVMGAPGWPVFDAHIVGDKITANFGRQPFAYTMPTGYSALDAAPVASPKTVAMAGKVSSAALGTAKSTMYVGRATGTTEVRPTVASTARFGTAAAKVVTSLKPAGIASTAAIGAAKVNHVLKGAGRASTAAMGTAKIIHVLKATGIAPASTLGALKVSQVLKAAGRASTVAFGTHKTILKVTGAGIASTAALGAHKLGTKVSPAGVSPTAALGTPKANYKLPGTGIATTARFGSHRIVSKIALAGIAPASALGSLKVGQRISVSGKATGVQIGVLSLKTIVRVAPTGLASTAALGSPVLGSGKVTLVPPGIPSTALLGEHTFRRGAVRVAPAGLSSSERFGTLTTKTVVHTSGLDVGSSVGVPSLKAKYRLAPTGVSSTSQAGLAAVQRGKVIVQAAGLPSVAALGGPSVATGKVTVSTPGISAGSMMGSPAVGTGAVTTSPAAISPTEALGTPTLTAGPVTLAVAGIEPSSALGNAEVTVATIPGAVFWDPASLQVGDATAITYSEGGRMVTNPTYYAYLTTNVGRSAGQFYFEINGFADYTFEAGLSRSGLQAVEYMVSEFGRYYDTPAGTNESVFPDPNGHVPTAMMFAVDLDAGLLWIGKDGTWSGEPGVTGGRPIQPGEYFPAVVLDQAFARGHFASGDFLYAVPAGFMPWQEDLNLQVLKPRGIAPTTSTGSPTLLAGSATIAPVSIIPTAALGQPTISDKISVAGIPASGGLGTPKMGQTTYVMSIARTRLGSPSVIAGARTLSPAGIAPSSALGEPALSTGGALLRPQGIARTSRLGIADLSTGPVSVRPGSIVSGAVGNPSLKHRVDTSSIDSTAAFGTLQIKVGVISVQAQGIAPASRLGTPAVRRGGVKVEPSSVSPSSQVGQPEVLRQAILRVPGLPSGTAFGVSIIRTSGVEVTVPGIPSNERLGLPYVFTGERPIGLPAYSFKVPGHEWLMKVPPTLAGMRFKVPTMQTFKFKVPRRQK